MLWTWSPPEGTPIGETVVTNNLLFVSTSQATYAVDLATHGTVWSYPEAGALALSSQGLLLMTVEETVVALDAR